MPQMAPINWFILFLYFFIIFYYMMNMMYFNFIKIKKNKSLKKNNFKNYNKFI